MSKHTTVEIPKEKDENIKFPIIYRDGVNVRLWGLQKFHPFDSCKFEKIRDKLNAMNTQTVSNWGIVYYCAPNIDFYPIYGEEIASPIQQGEKLLLYLHDEEYIERSKTREGLAAICETRIIKYKTEEWWNFGYVNQMLDSFLIDNLRNPMLVHVYNTVEGTLLALRYGRAICLSGILSM